MSRTHDNLSLTEMSYLNMQRIYSMDGRLVNHIPDTIEVIRCKDCMHYELFPNGCNGICDLGVDARKSFYPWDYCSKGERREDETDKADA